MPEPWEAVKKQNEIIIRLLGRVAFTKEQIREIVVYKKQNPDNYVKGCDACDGKKGVIELAKIVRVSHGTLSAILQDWEERGIIYRVESSGAPGRTINCSSSHRDHQPCSRHHCLRRKHHNRDCRRMLKVLDGSSPTHQSLDYERGQQMFADTGATPYGVPLTDGFELLTTLWITCRCVIDLRKT